MVYNISDHFHNTNIRNTNLIDVFHNKNEITFEEALIKASNLIFKFFSLHFHFYSKKNGKSTLSLYFLKFILFFFYRIWKIQLFFDTHQWRYHGNNVLRNDGDKLCFASC